jgi:hypothetical protein
VDKRPEEFENTGLYSTLLVSCPLSTVPVFSKTAQGGNQKLADSKWLVANTEEESILGAPKFAEELNGAMSSHVRKQ